MSEIFNPKSDVTISFLSLILNSLKIIWPLKSDIFIFYLVTPKDIK